MNCATRCPGSIWAGSFPASLRSRYFLAAFFDFAALGEELALDTIGQCAIRVFVRENERGLCRVVLLGSTDNPFARRRKAFVVKQRRRRLKHHLVTGKPYSPRKVHVIAVQEECFRIKAINFLCDR